MKRKFSETDIGVMLDTRKRLKMKLCEEPYDKETEAQLSKVDETIAKKTEEKYHERISQTLGHLTGVDGGVNTNGLWKATNKIIPKDKVSIPVETLSQIQKASVQCVLKKSQKDSDTGKCTKLL